MDNPNTEETEAQQAGLVSAARLFGRILVEKLNQQALSELLAPEVSSALSAVGVDVTSIATMTLSELAVQYSDHFDNPPGGPAPVQSLWSEGVYAADDAGAIERLAQSGGLAFDNTSAQGVPSDHIGSILLLWATAKEKAPTVAKRLEDRHLAWAMQPLGILSGRSGFYGEVAVASAALIDAIRS